MTGDPFWRAIDAQDLTVSPAVEAFHAGLGTKTYRGSCNIVRGAGWRARLALWLVGFPPAGERVPTRVTITTHETGCIWERDFGGHLTRLYLSFDPASARVIERFGLIRLALAVDADAGRLRIGVAAMRLCYVPLPKAFLPISETTEATGEDGAFRFDVSARAPGIGHLISYCGDLNPVPARSSPPKGRPCETGGNGPV